MSEKNNIPEQLELPFTRQPTPEEIAQLEAELSREVEYIERVKEMFPEAAAAAGDNEELFKQIKEKAPEVEKAAVDEIIADMKKNREKDGVILLKSVLRRITSTMEQYREQMISAAAAFAETEEWRKTRGLFDCEPIEEDGLDQNLEDILSFIATADLIEFQAFIEYFEKIYPAAQEVIGEIREKTGQPVRLEDFFSNEDDNENWKKSIYEMAIERSKLPPPEKGELRTTVKKITVKKIEKALIPIDKLSFKLITERNAFAGKEFAINTMERNSDTAAGIVFTINPAEELGGAKALEKNKHFKSRILSGIASLWAQELIGGDNEERLFKEDGSRDLLCSDAQLWAAMGYPSDPSTQDRKKLNTALTEMRRAEIKISNKSELAAGYHCEEIEYDGSYLPFERVTARINGVITKSALHFFREPIVITNARKRKHITTVPVELLHAPVSKTEGNTAIESYLIRRIAQAKNARKPSETILFDTIFDNAGITNRTKKYEKMETVYTFLDHFKSKEYITKYTKKKEKDGKKIVGVVVYLKADNNE